jgi:hypothetical protein
MASGRFAGAQASSLLEVTPANVVYPVGRQAVPIPRVGNISVQSEVD